MAKTKPLLRQMEVFDEICSHDLTPNQYYLLCCMRDSISPVGINLSLELRLLKEDEWINKNNNLTPKASTLITTVEQLFKVQKTKTSRRLMGDDFRTNMKKFQELIPDEILPSGKAARSSMGNVEKAFRWFFTNYDYTWDQIFKATLHYVNEQRVSNRKYQRTSQYFIRKNDKSDLADQCELIRPELKRTSEGNHDIKIV